MLQWFCISSVLRRVLTSWVGLSLFNYWPATLLVFFFPLSLQVGTSSVVYPAAMFAPQVSARGVPVAEFNMEATPATNRFR